MTNNELTNALYRPLKDAKQYNSLFAPSTCVSQTIGSGTTEYGINQIKNWVLENIGQINVSEAKKHFLKPTLQQTTTAIHQFAYHHFQYKADDLTQHLMSPSCSFNKRNTGVDCKTYSVIISSLLSVLNIKHYIRRIKQPFLSPDQWSHVYVIVPKNQKTGSLLQGYFTADGTIPTTTEPTKTQKHDIYMEANLTYVGMKGAAQDNFLVLTQALLQKGANPTAVNQLIQAVNNQLKSGRTDFPIGFKRGAIIINGQTIEFAPINNVVNPNHQTPIVQGGLKGFFSSFSDAWSDISGVATTTWGNLTGNSNATNGGTSTLITSIGASSSGSGTTPTTTQTDTNTGFDWGGFAGDILGTAAQVGGQLILNNNTPTGSTSTPTYVPTGGGYTPNQNTPSGGLTYQQQLQLAQANNQPLPEEKDNSTLYWILGGVAVLGVSAGGYYLYTKKKK